MEVKSVYKEISDVKSEVREMRDYLAYLIKEAAKVKN